MPINQFYAKIGFQQSQLQSNINSQPKQSSTYTQPQHSNNTQPKITTNKTSDTQAQIAVNPTIKNNDNEFNQTDNSIYFWIIGTIVIIFLLRNNKKEHLKKHNEDNYYPKNYNSTSNSDTIMDFLIKTFTYCFMILIFLAGMFQYYATFVYYNSYLHWEVATSIFTAVLIHLIPFIGGFIGSFLSVIAATHVWGWDLWIAVLIFFPKTVMGALGLSIASISSLFNNKN
jgi:hypothetical protein